MQNFSFKFFLTILKILCFNLFLISFSLFLPSKYFSLKIFCHKTTKNCDEPGQFD